MIFTFPPLASVQLSIGAGCINADAALRLARYFKTNPEFWRNLENSYELELTRRSGSLAEITRHVHPQAELVS